MVLASKPTMLLTMAWAMKKPKVTKAMPTMMAGKPDNKVTHTPNNISAKPKITMCF